MKTLASQRSVSRLLVGLSTAVLAGAAMTTSTAGAALLARPVVDTSAEFSFADVAKVGDKITIKLKDGRTIEGEVIAIDADVIKLKQKVGALFATLEYQRNDIETTALVEASADKPKEADKPAEKPAVKPASGTDAAKPADTNSSDKAKVYLIPFRGEFGRDISKTPMEDVMKDVKKAQPDYLIISIDCAFKFEGQQGRDEIDFDGMRLSWGQGFETAAELATLFTDTVRDDKTWVKKPKLVMWVRHAMGPVAFLPWVSPTIYFTTDGRQGGIGYLEHLFDGVGDETVRQKQYSLRLGRAEGLAAKGGYNTLLIRAMAYMKEVLSVSFVGGEPEYHMDRTGDELLTDSGMGGEADSLEERVRLEGNDCLNLNAQMAVKLKVAKGIADTRDQLMFELGIDRNFEEVKGKAEKIFRDWSADVSAAQKEIPKLFREAQETAVTGNTPDLRNSARGKRMGLLKKVIEKADKYGEALPRVTQGGQLQIRCRVEIEQLKQAIMLDK